MDPGSIPENWRKAENGRPHFELEGGRVFIHERGCLRTTSKTLGNGKSYSVRQVWQKFTVLAGEARRQLVSYGFATKKWSSDAKLSEGETPKAVSLNVCAHSFLFPEDMMAQEIQTWQSCSDALARFGKINLWSLGILERSNAALFNTPLWVLAIFYASKKCCENTRVPKSNQTILGFMKCQLSDSHSHSVQSLWLLKVRHGSTSWTSLGSLLQRDATECP